MRNVAILTFVETRKGLDIQKANCNILLGNIT